MPSFDISGFDISGFDISGFDISGPLLLLGSIFGIGYALLGIGLVLAYRSSGFINFAHGSIGLVAASMMSVVVNDYGVPYWLGFVGALIVAALLAAGIEAFVVRKLAAAPRVLSMVATLGAAQALLLLALSFSKGGLGGGSFPQPPGLPRIRPHRLRFAFIDGAAVPVASRGRGAVSVPATQPIRPGNPRGRGQPRFCDPGWSRPPAHGDAFVGARRSYRRVRRHPHHRKSVDGHRRCAGSRLHHPRPRSCCARQVLQPTGGVGFRLGDRDRGATPGVQPRSDRLV